MVPEVSASFQAVEDWLRSLGLLHYAQSFYDNGYEDLETCKLMKEEDLNVIDIKTEQDRQDILNGIYTLKQNLYFELEPENSENIAERTKIDPLVLKTKLKECLGHEKIQLTEPPYYNKDGTPGDLYPLAIKYAADLSTCFDDVLSALEQLRKRQLSNRTYDDMVTESPSNIARDQESRRSLRNVSNPAEYLNCETPSYPKRSSSFSRYDTRVTKSTTDLSKDIINSGSVSPKGKHQKRKGFLGSIFKRDNGGRTGQTNKAIEYKASDLTLTQNEIVDIFQQVKSKEMSQEDALDLIRRHGLTKSTSYDGGSPGSLHKHIIDQNPSVLLGKEGVILKPKSRSKSGLKARCPSAQFYTQADDDISQSSVSLISNESKSSLEISGDHVCCAVDEDSISISSKYSPDFGKKGIFKKIRNSIRKKNKLTEGEFSSEEKECNGMSPEKRSIEESESTNVRPNDDHITEDMLALPDKTEHSDDNSSLTPKSSPKINLARVGPLTPPPSTPPPPPPFEDMIQEDTGFRERTPSLKIKSYPMNQDEISKRRALEKNNNVPKSDLSPRLDSHPLLVPKTEIENIINKELVTELNKIVPKVPPRPPVVPPRNRSRLSRAESTDSTDREIDIDNIVKEISEMQADLNTHLLNVNADHSASDKSNVVNENCKKTETDEPKLVVKPYGWKKPVPPPRMHISSESKTSFGHVLVCDQKNINKKKPSEVVTKRQLLEKKLFKESIHLGEHPYTSHDGSWRVPYNLLLRYENELSYSIDDIIKCFEEIRVEKGKITIPYTEKDLQANEPFKGGGSAEDFLLHIGLPMYTDDFLELNIRNLQDVKELDKDDIKHIGIFDISHVTWLQKHMKSLIS